jgi:hypothetical protein
MSKEIKDYVSMMEHTLRRRMDSQAGKEELIKEYTEKMEQGLNAINRLAEIETPPTADQVCEALSEYFGETIILNPATCEFMNVNCFANDVNSVTHTKITEWFEPYNTYSIIEPLPPHLITLIGRFYEGRDEK